MGKYFNLLEDVKFFYEKADNAKDKGDLDEASRYIKIAEKLQAELLMAAGRKK